MNGIVLKGHRKGVEIVALPTKRTPKPKRKPTKRRSAELFFFEKNYSALRRQYAIRD